MILYTQAQVQTTQLQAAQALAAISRKIEQFVLFITPTYSTYKQLQYDIYTLLDVINNEKPFISFSPSPSLYEMMYYELVGSLINKINLFDSSGVFGGTINSNAQAGSISIVQVPVLVGFNSGKLPFTTVSGAGLTLSYAQYQSVYGNNPTLALVDNAGNPLYIEDKQTPPQYTFTNDDPNQPLTQVFWDIPFATSGYIQISGLAPSIATGTPTGGSSTYLLNFTQANLLDAGGGNWYLPLPLPTGKYPVYVTINGVGGVAGEYDTNASPARLYGFASNATQSIIIKVA